MMAILISVRWYLIVVLICILIWFFSVLLRKLFIPLAPFELGCEGGKQKQVNATLISHWLQAATVTGIIGPRLSAFAWIPEMREEKAAPMWSPPRSGLDPWEVLAPRAERPAQAVAMFPCLVVGRPSLCFPIEIIWRRAPSQRDREKQPELL